LKHLKIKVGMQSTITLIIGLKQKVYTWSLMFAYMQFFKRVSTKQVQCWKQPICDFHMLIMFLQDAHIYIYVLVFTMKWNLTRHVATVHETKMSYWCCSTEFADSTQFNKQITINVTHILSVINLWSIVNNA